MAHLRDAPRGDAFAPGAGLDPAAIERYAAMHPARARPHRVVTAVLAFGAAGLSLGAVAIMTVYQVVDGRRHGHLGGHDGHLGPPAHVEHVHVAPVPPVPDLPHPPPAPPEFQGRPGEPGQPYFEFQVEKPVVPAPGNQGPRYPDILRSASVEGEVLAQFVVDHHGRVDMDTFRALRSSHALFTDAVRASLEGARYSPAEVGGVRVKQVVQQPFGFRLTR